ASAHGKIIRDKIHDEVVLPAGPFRGAPSLFVKPAGKRGIFDRMGWQEIRLETDCREAATLWEDPLEQRCVAAIIPCYNVAETCGTIVRAATAFAGQVIAVNDGSTDGTKEVLDAVAREYPGRVHVLGWSSNQGKGAALIEAFRYVAEMMPSPIVVTLDGDGQHQPRDIARLAQTLAAEECELVIGERLAREKMPLRSRVGNMATAGLIQWVYPAAPEDTQSGFRAFAPDFVREIVKVVPAGRYETELRILLLALRQRRRIGSVTIPTLYIDDNRLSHFRPLVDSWRIYRTLFACWLL
ncbi:MAG: glycosyltransferase family 2 protein, partial [Opitutaceae bacterium]